MTIQANPSYSATPITASAVIKNGQGVVGSIICVASTGGTIALYDGLSASGTNLIATMTLTAGQVYPLNIACGTGIYIAVGGTLSATVTWV